MLRCVLHEYDNYKNNDDGDDDREVGEDGRNNNNGCNMNGTDVTCDMSQNQTRQDPIWLVAPDPCHRRVLHTGLSTRLHLDTKRLRI